MKSLEPAAESVVTMGRLLLAVGSLASAVALADPAAEFRAAYEAYRDAVEASRVWLAVQHAQEARRLGEQVFADDPRVRAKLVLNHGVALARMPRKWEAQPVLKEARKQMREAFGRNAVELVEVELALLKAVPRQSGRTHRRNALRLARRHHPEDSAFVAQVKLTSGMTLWWDGGAPRLLAEAAETFKRLGDQDNHVLALFWIGKIHQADGKHREVTEAMDRVLASVPADHRLALSAHADLVRAFEELGERDRATEHCLKIGRATPWQGVTDYQPLFKRPPSYPRSERAAGKEGFVVVGLTVDASGFVRNPQVVASTGGPNFEAAALKSIRAARYAPRFVDGEPVEVTGVTYRVVFALER